MVPAHLSVLVDASESEYVDVLCVAVRLILCCLLTSSAEATRNLIQNLDVAPTPKNASTFIFADKQASQDEFPIFEFCLRNGRLTQAYRQRYQILFCLC
jgi:hypothetical protein